MRPGHPPSCAWAVGALTLTALLAGGCETTRQIGKTAGRAIRGQGLETKGIEEAIARDTDALGRELQRMQRQFAATVARLRSNIQKRWGEEETKVAQRTVYVKYTQSYRSRAVVDFDRGLVTVETLDAQDPTGSLKSAIVTTLLTTNDPQAVDLFSDKSVDLATGREPYLMGLVVDQEGRAVRTPAQAERFARQLIGSKLEARAFRSEEGDRTARYVRIPMVANFESRKAEMYRPLVDRYASQYEISPSLVYAIIRAESNFNPFAVSPAPAYGLMQLVPSSGGLAGYRRAKGVDQVPSPDYLFDAANNIELGTAYLNVLRYTEFGGVPNPISRDYCVIAAYNTGPGNVLRTFSSERAKAYAEINRLEPAVLYERLRSSLPYAETRQYLATVVGHRRQFVSRRESSP